MDRIDIRSKRNLFIVVEGLSGSGKTTVGQLIAKKIGAVFYKTPAPLFEPIRNEVDRKADTSARLFFYLSGVIQASAEISRILSGKPVVSDRYLLTTLCYHRALGTLIDVPDCVFNKMLSPDRTFLITCKEEKRLSRLYSRGLSYNDKQEQRLKVERKFLSEYKKYRLIEIDNSSDDPSEAADEILRFLKRGQN